ncbi:MAG: hypothetical protein BJ554DRAFT_2653 [Olpidium bornovanus]|uniref:Uncharacterized protein n=1 Tax=Olpidium bornovanus TaxID=278681 RepID=A0A8H8DGS6_9FUNG|nr:MAG: hypothetical protein BJ554DRAFT_2653 [Olpidium bornovanus]
MLCFASDRTVNVPAKAGRNRVPAERCRGLASRFQPARLRLASDDGHHRTRLNDKQHGKMTGITTCLNEKAIGRGHELLFTGRDPLGGPGSTGIHSPQTCQPGLLRRRGGAGRGGAGRLLRAGYSVNGRPCGPLSLAVPSAPAARPTPSLVGAVRLCSSSVGNDEPRPGPPPAPRRHGQQRAPPQGSHGGRARRGEELPGQEVLRGASEWGLPHNSLNPFRFVSEYISTIGIDYGVKTALVTLEDGRSVESKINFWDVAGDGVYYEVRNEFYKDTQGVRAFPRIGSFVQDLSGSRPVPEF